MRYLLLLVILLAGCMEAPQSSTPMTLPAEQPCCPVRCSKPRLLVFTAEWCPACRAASPTIQAIKGVDVVVINCDDQPDAVAKYQVKSIPMFIYEDKRTNDPDEAASWFE
jgi:thiol-disulfide isomerase/thioredoxin